MSDATTGPTASEPRAPTPAGDEEERRAPSVTRRRALQVLAAGAAALPAAACAPEDGTPNRADARGGIAPPAGGNPRAAGTPTDPDLLDPVVPWDPVLTDGELVTLAALCDVIIPADDRSPAASEVGAHEFIDEWVGAPYDGNRDDLVLVRGGLAWLDRESSARFGAAFHQVAADRQTEICDEICYLPEAAPELRPAARFFDRVRDLTATAFWTTEEGMEDLGFVGNRPLPSFEGPPREVLERLGL